MGGVVSTRDAAPALLYPIVPVMIPPFLRWAGESGMSIIIDDPDIEALACLLAASTGESVEDAVARALKECLDAQPQAHRRPCTVEDLMRIGRECAALPVLDDRRPDELLGHGERGMRR